MNEQYVRGHWLIGGVKFLRSHFSQDVNEHLLGMLPRGLYASLAELQPAEWCERAHHVELLKVIAAAHREESAAFDSLAAYGQSVGSDLAGGVLRPMLAIMTPKLLAKKLPQLWANEHQTDGRLETDIAHADDGRLLMSLSNAQGYDHVGVATLGWVKGLLAALGCKDVNVKQSGWRLTQAAPAEMTCEVRWS